MAQAKRSMFGGVTHMDTGGMRTADAAGQQTADTSVSFPEGEPIKQAIAYHVGTVLPQLQTAANDAAAKVTEAQKALNAAGLTDRTAAQANLNSARDALGKINQQYVDETKVISDLTTKLSDAQQEAAKNYASLSPENRQKLLSEAQNNQAQAALYLAQYNNEVAKGQAAQKDAEYQQALQANTDPALISRLATEKGQLDNRVTAADAALKEADAAVAGGNSQATLLYNQMQAALAGSQARVGVATEGSQIAQAAGEAAQAQGKGAQEVAKGAHADDAVIQDIAETASRVGLNQAQTMEILAFLDQKKRYGEEQITNLQAQTAYQQLQTQQLKQGDVQTKIEQLGEAVKNGMPSWQADQLMEDYLSGSTPFDRQKQRESQISHAMDTALSYGMAVQPGQQYVPGFEPGGAFSGAGLGVSVPSVQLNHPQSLGQYLQGAGIQTQDQSPPQRFDAQGGYNAAAMPNQPAQQPQASMNGVPIQVTPAAAATPDQFHARAAAASAAKQVAGQVQTAAGGGTFGPPVRDDWATADYDPLWGLHPQEIDQFGPNGLPFRPGGMADQFPPLPLATPVPASVPLAVGGTVPRAMQGIPGTVPKVERIKIFAPRGKGTAHRPMFARR